MSSSAWIGGKTVAACAMLFRASGVLCSAASRVSEPSSAMPSAGSPVKVSEDRS